jgi:YVTN family beta-propeller protein
VYLESEIQLKYLFVTTAAIVLALPILMSCELYGQESELATSDVRINTIKLATNPSMVAVDPTTNKVYVTHSDSNTVSVIDSTTDKVVGNVTIRIFHADIAVDPATKKVYVANVDPTRSTFMYQDKTVYIINGTTDKVVGNVTVGASPCYLW